VRDEARLRQATLADLEEVLALWSHYLRTHRDNPAYRLAARGLEKRRDTFRRHIEGPESAVFVLERPDGGLDGMVTCFVEENLPYFMPPRFARIQTPYVRPDARRRGNLKRLLTAALRWAREEELMEIRLYTSAGNVMGNAIADELGFEAVEIVRRKPVDWRSPPEEQIED
jgi:GNAT superfamily N-acetyltransferase